MVCVSAASSLCWFCWLLGGSGGALVLLRNYRPQGVRGAAAVGQLAPHAAAPRGVLPGRIAGMCPDRAYSSPKASCFQQGAFALLDSPPDGKYGDHLFCLVAV